MFRWIVEISLKFRYLILALAFAMVIYGVVKFRDMPIDVFPEFAPPYVEIQTEGLGMSPIEVEEIITIPMEASLRGTPQLDVIRSQSVEGLSSIKMIFKMGTDILRARQRVHERLVLVKNDIPSFANPIVLQPLSATSRVMKIGLTSETISLEDLSMIAYWKMRFRLMRIPGVANVAIWGERIKALQAQIDPEKLKKYDLGLNTIQTIASDSLDFGLLPYSSSAQNRIDGFIDTPNQRLDIKYILPIFGPKEFAKIPLKIDNGNVITLDDVADIKWDHPLLIGDAVINDGPGLMLIVEKFPWANTLGVTHDVEKALAEMRPGLPDIEINAKIFRPATFIEMAIDNLSRSLLLGCILVVLVLIAFLYEWRVALISCMAIPLSLIAATIIFYWQGDTINTMVLAGFVVALGAVVDDAIVDVENITRRMRLHRLQGSGQSAKNIIVDASLEVRKSIVYSTLIEIAALLPVFFMQGLSGSFFKPLATAYVLAVIASTIVALTVTPALSLIMLENAPLDNKQSPLLRLLLKGYNFLLTRILSNPKPAYATVAVLIAAGAVIYPRLGQELLPSFKERDFLMHWLTKPGTSRTEMYRITVQASKELRQIPGVNNFGAHIGRALVADEVVGINFTENWVSVDPAAPYDETLETIQSAVDGYPGLYRDVQTYLKERIREVLTGAGEAIVLRVFGSELEILRSTAKKVREAVSDVDGLIDLHVEPQVEIPQISVRVNASKAERYGVKPGDVRRLVAIMTSGNEVSDIHRDTKVYDVMLWSIPSARNSIDDLKAIQIDTANNGRMRLDEVADISITPTPNEIKREGASRRIDIIANVRGRDLGSVVRDIEERLQAVPLPLGYHIEMLGEYAERQATLKGIITVSIIAMLIIYLLLYTSFENWRLATISFLTLPAALVGGVLVVYLSSAVISLGSLVGFLTVLGIAARNGILMVNHFQHLEKVEGMRFSKELVLHGASERLSPILMTTLTTTLALVPLVFAGDIPGHEIELPTAIVILGGLFTATLLNLFVIPPLYLRYSHSDAMSD